MIQKLTEFFLHEKFRNSNSSDLFRARLMVQISLILWLAALVFFLSFTFVFSSTFNAVALLITLLLATGGVFLFKYTGSIPVTSNIYSFALYFSVTMVVYSTGGLESSVAGWLVFTPLNSALTNGSGKSWKYWIVITMATVILVAIGHLTWYKFPNDISPELTVYFNVLVVSGIIFMGTFFIFIFQIIAENAVEQNKRESTRVKLVLDQIKESLPTLQKATDNAKSSILSLTQTSNSISLKSGRSSEDILTVKQSLSVLSNVVEKISTLSQGQSANLNQLMILTVNLQDINQNLGSSVLKSKDHMQNAFQSAGEGATSLKEMNSSMQKIEDSFQKMSEITGFIHEIADRINLLSLNASIEAARAGDYGRGFAVVAKEVSKLADQTASSIKQTDSHMKFIQREILEGRNIVKAGTDIFTSIIDRIASLNSEFETLSKILKDQLESYSDMNERISQNNEDYQTVKISIKEEKAAMQQIDSLVKNLEDNMQEFLNQAGSLLESVKLSENTVEDLNHTFNNLKNRVEE
jgi:methyl-accepting chemotaxis protein